MLTTIPVGVGQRQVLYKGRATALYLVSYSDAPDDSMRPEWGVFEDIPRYFAPLTPSDTPQWPTDTVRCHFLPGMTYLACLQVCREILSNPEALRRLSPGPMESAA